MKYIYAACRSFLNCATFKSACNCMQLWKFALATFICIVKLIHFALECLKLFYRMLEVVQSLSFFSSLSKARVSLKNIRLKTGLNPLQIMCVMINYSVTKFLHSRAICGQNYNFYFFRFYRLNPHLQIKCM